MRLDVPVSIPRAALVTGGAHRLGRAITLALSEAGFHVAIHCHRSATADPMVSVVLPTCNRLHYLRSAIDSVLDRKSVV